MEFEVRDGKGSGRRLSINPLNRAETESVTFDREDDAILRGVGYQISSGPITYTGGSEPTPVGVLYFRNEEDVDVVLDRVVLMIGSNAEAAGDWTHTILRNPTVGSTITSASPAGISNSNHGSNNVLNSGVNIFKASAETDTLDDGTGAPLPIQQQSNRIVFPVGRRIPKGSSFGIRITPPTLPNNATITSVSVAHVFLDTNQV